MSSSLANYVLVKPKPLSEPIVIGRSESVDENGNKKSRRVLKIELGYFDNDNNLLYKIDIHSNIIGKIV